MPITMFNQVWIQAVIFLFAVLPLSKTGTFVQGQYVKKVPGKINAKTVIESYPYQVAILNNGNYYCGGTLLPSRRHVLTAAHCLRGLDVKSLTVRLGTGSIYPPESNYIDRNVTGYICHEDYNPISYENDVAVMSFTEPVSLRFVKLELKPLETYTNRAGTILGWGNPLQLVSPPSPSLRNPSGVLKQSGVIIANTTQCGLSYHFVSLHKSVLLYMKPLQFLCTSSLSRTDPCQGDDGSPLILNGTQIGILGNRDGCFSSGYRIYTRVGFYMRWIKKTPSKLP